MATKQFDISDVLSITTGRLVSTRHMDGVYDILNYMTGESLFTHQLGRASDACKPELLRQFPILDSGEMQFALGRLILLLDSEVTKGHESALIDGWLMELTCPNGYASIKGKQGVVFRRELNVSPLPSGAYDAREPIGELADMMPDKSTLIVVGA